MKRTYEGGMREGVTYFVGREVEKTAAHGKRTLFVVGVHAADFVVALAESQSVEHIYFGANFSFQGAEPQAWSEMVCGCHDRFQGMITFDVRSRLKRLVDIWFDDLYTSSRFILMLSVPVIEVSRRPENTFLKIDDVGFDVSNAGVWVTPIRDLLSQEGLTTWSEYASDRVID